TVAGGVGGASGIASGGRLGVSLTSGADLASRATRDELAKTLNEQDDYVEYHVTLKGGMLTHARIVVLYSKRRTFSLLDDKRKLRHEHNLMDILSIEIPHTGQMPPPGATPVIPAPPKGKPEVFVVFKKTSKEKAINFEFQDST